MEFKTTVGLPNLPGITDKFFQVYRTFFDNIHDSIYCLEFVFTVVFIIFAFELVVKLLSHRMGSLFLILGHTVRCSKFFHIFSGIIYQMENRLWLIQNHTVQTISIICTSTVHQRCSTWYLYLYSSITRAQIPGTCTRTCTCRLSTCTWYLGTCTRHLVLVLAAIF